MQAEVHKLEADNAMSAGGARASLILAKSEKAVQEREVKELKRLLRDIVNKEEQTWESAMALPDPKALASAKVRAKGFGAVSSASEKICLRYYLTVQHELKEHKLSLTSTVKVCAVHPFLLSVPLSWSLDPPPFPVCRQTAADLWAARLRAAQLRAARLIQRAFRRRKAAEEAARKANEQMGACVLLYVCCCVLL